MTDQPLPTSAAALRALREAFAASAKSNLDRFDKLIAEAAKAEWQQARAHDLAQITPGGNDRAHLRGHDIVFLINKSKDMGEGITSAVGAAVSVAHMVYAAVKGCEVEGMTVSARRWGISATSEILLDNPDKRANTYDKTDTNTKDFLPVAKEILLANTPDKQSGRHTHYIIICDGNITDSIGHVATILEAAAKFNPKASFDFVACGANAGNVDELVKTWPAAASQKPRLTRVGTPADIAEAVTRTIKSRICETAAIPAAVALKAYGLTE